MFVPVFIDVITKEEHVQWDAHNARQLILQDHWTTARPAQQQCYEVVVVKNALQTSLVRFPQKNKISEQIHRNIKLATGRQDDYSANFVKDALIIYERILTVPTLAQMIVEQEKRDGQNALWNSIGKLVVLASKTADQEERKWVMDSLED